jgi:hypothetical protein
MARNNAHLRFSMGLDIGGSSMTALVQAISRISASATASTNLETETLVALGILSGAGLAVSLIFASYGLDLSAGFF